MALFDTRLPIAHQRAGTTSHAFRLRLNSWGNMLACAAGTVVFTTGLVLLTRFHMALGCLRGESLGLSRLAWVNLHRGGAVLLMAAIVVHVALHWRTLVCRTSRALARLPGRATNSDLVLYFGFPVVGVAGTAAWLFLPGSPPLWGPVTLGPLPPLRHLCIDVHNIVGVALFVAAVLHVRRHIDWLLRACGWRCERSSTTSLRTKTEKR